MVKGGYRLVTLLSVPLTTVNPSTPRVEYYISRNSVPGRYSSHHGFLPLPRVRIQSDCRNIYLIWRRREVSWDRRCIFCFRIIHPRRTEFKRCPFRRIVLRIERLCRRNGGA